MMLGFEEVDKSWIVNSYPSYVHEQARYFRITKGNKTMCFYGIIAHTDEVCEAFLMMKTFRGKVLTKGFFVSLFHHVFSLGYREVWTWTKWDRLIKLFTRFERFGIKKTGSPPWDNNSPTKTWFLRKVKEGG